MVIRSQDKTVFINFDNAQIIRIFEMEDGSADIDVFTIGRGFETIGSYKNKEIAMSVLDKFQLEYIYSMNVATSSVYQMPPDEV